MTTTTPPSDAALPNEPQAARPVFIPARQAPAAPAAADGAPAAPAARPGRPDPASPEYLAEMAARGRAGREAHATHPATPPGAREAARNPAGQVAPAAPAAAPAAADGGQAAAARQRPAEIPEKFWDPVKGEVRAEALARSYRELERRLGQRQAAPAAPAAPKAPAAAAGQAAPSGQEAPAATEGGQAAPAALEGGLRIPEGPVGQADAERAQAALAALEIPEDADAFTASEAVLTSAGLDPVEVTRRLIETGDLSPEDYAALQAQGLPKAVIRAQALAMRTAIQAEQEKNAAAALSYVGGETQMTALMHWAQGALTETEKTDFNARLNSGEWRMALDALRGRFLSAGGRFSAPAPARSGAPRPALVGGGAPATGTVGFRSHAEQNAAIRDPRYRTDPAYRDEVAARIRARTF